MESICATVLRRVCRLLIVRRSTEPRSARAPVRAALRRTVALRSSSPILRPIRFGQSSRRSLFRTGFAQALLEMNKEPDVKTLFATTSALDGRDVRLHQWVTDCGAVALIADNYGVESVPPRPCMDDFCAMLPLHAHCLFRLGCYLGEMWYLTELADWLRANKRSRFMLTAPPLRLPGAVGSPATPVATV